MCKALRTFFHHQGYSIAEAARQLGENRETVRTWLNKGVVPRPETIVRIYHWSKRKVQPNDFYDLSDPGPLDGLPLFEAGGNKPNGFHINAEGT